MYILTRGPALILPALDKKLLPGAACMQCLHVHSDSGPGAPTGVTRLGSPASPRIMMMVPVDAAACRAYRDPGVETTFYALRATELGKEI